MSGAAFKPNRDVMPALARTPVKSSHLRSVGYDPVNQHMQIEFRDGSVYDYPGVPPAAHTGLMSAPSKGKYYRSAIRPRHPAIKRK